MRKKIEGKGEKGKEERNEGIGGKEKERKKIKKKEGRKKGENIKESLRGLKILGGGGGG